MKYIYLYIVILFFLLFSYNINYNIIDIFSISTITSIALLSTIIFILKKDYTPQLKNNYFRHSLIFLFGYITVHFYCYFQLITGNIDSNDMYYWINKSIVNKSSTLSAIGIISLFIGYSIKYYKLNYNTYSYKKIKLINENYIVYFSLIVIAVYLININPLYIAGNYGNSVDRGTISEYMGTLFESLVIIYISTINIKYKIKNINIKSIYQYIKKCGLFFNILIFLYLFPVLVSGERNPIIFVGLSYIGGAIFSVSKKIKLHILILFISLAMFTATLLSNARSADKSLSFIDKISSSLENKDTKYQDNASELASSIRTLHIAVDYVPNNRQFFYGQFQFQTIIISIPGLFGIYANILEIEKRYQSSGQFITWIEQGNNPDWGVGTTCTADLYLDFGVIGVIFGMFLFGILLRRCEEIVYVDKYPTVFNYILALSVFSLSVYMSRSTLLYSVRLAIFTYIIYLLFYLVSPTQQFQNEQK